ncbi:hypothetical protein, conserved [Plasmodium gonderi]|uniref:t-SNARE coiled-coil homology domain-containing protein n=1 Tax=Plasmodium gonderi TaxID=77519 RepID=A0A1Y1JQE9_PLAGO|nr:hypothetical protein, conserved [Plasmodium gonderi]GAW82294.1 hypothetical protein, conserved [Plasmodium gonderi]
MDRSDEFTYLCKKCDKNVSFTKREIKCKDAFLIKSSKIYTSLLTNCDYIDNNTLAQYGLFFRRSKYVREKKTRIKSKDNLLYAVNRISDEIKLLKPQTEIHKHVLNCLNNLLNIFIDIINKYEHNLSSYHLKLSKYTNFYFYDVKNIKYNFEHLDRLNCYIYSASSCDSKFNEPSVNFFLPAGFTSHHVTQTNYDRSNKLVSNNGQCSKDYTEALSRGVNHVDSYTKGGNDKNYNFDESGKQMFMPNNDNMKEPTLRKRRDKKVTFDTYDFVEEEAEKSKREFISNNDNYGLNNNQQLEFKKYVDLFEKEENTYIMETKKKIAKISNLMNIFVTKIYEQNENLSMIEHVVEESIENVSQGNIYLNKIQNKKSMNSLLFFVLICTSIFLFIFDYFR